MSSPRGALCSSRHGAFAASSGGSAGCYFEIVVTTMIRETSADGATPMPWVQDRDPVTDQWDPIPTLQERKDNWKELWRFNPRLEELNAVFPIHRDTIVGAMGTRDGSFYYVGGSNNPKKIDADGDVIWQGNDAFGGSSKVAINEQLATAFTVSKSGNDATVHTWEMFPDPLPPLQTTGDPIDQLLPVPSDPIKSLISQPLFDDLQSPPVMRRGYGADTKNVANNLIAAALFDVNPAISKVAVYDADLNSTWTQSPLHSNVYLATDAVGDVYTASTLITTNPNQTSDHQAFLRKLSKSDGSLIWEWQPDKIPFTTLYAPPALPGLLLHTITGEPLAAFSDRVVTTLWTVLGPGPPPPNPSMGGFWGTVSEPLEVEGQLVIINAETGEFIKTIDLGFDLLDSGSNKPEFVVAPDETIFVAQSRRNDWTGSNGEYASIWRLDRDGNIINWFDFGAQGAGLRPLAMSLVL